ncbi:hypothetical protein QJQ45_007296 [Haematococcus lacustris]|nr:hypothetical protein QJQ45_007296 [Haematococcus lacustris]
MSTLQASVTVAEKLASGTCLVSSSGRPPGPRGPPGRYSRRSLPLLKPLLLGRLVPSLQVGLQVRMLMLQPMKGYDVLLGGDWFFANKAILSYEGKTLSLSAAGKTAVTLPCPAVAAPKYVGQCSAVRPTPAFLINALKAKPELISATQASRWLLKGGRAVVALVMAEGSASASPGTPSDQDNPHIPAAIKAELQTLLNEYSDVFKPLTDTPPERPVGHTIPLVPDARPPVTPMYRLSKPEQEELKRRIQDYLSKGMIEPSSSPYAAPILFVQKKSGELRMCIDYRQLNKLTLRDQYPLPRIDDLFDRLSGCSVFSSLDLQAGYHQIRITPEDVPKTAFRTPEGQFQFKVLSFGLTNAPATFQRVMNDAFAPVLGKCALVYLDDILVMSKSLPEHLQHLRLVFDLLRKNKLYAKMSKCEFMQLTLRFLGHVISAGAISVDPDKVRAIVDWPVPSSLTQLQSFLGAANFVRKFVQGFSAISAPLTDLCGKLSATFPWHSWPDHERLAFYELKAAVANVPMLRLPDHTQPFQVYCDASLQGVGAVLMQDGYPLAYLSKKLSSAEVNYTTGEQEMLALVTACKEWRCYLEGVPFTLFTDHKPLISLPTQKNLSRRQARWMELLSRFDFKLEYIPGPVNPADPLSRLITGPQEGATVCAMLTRRQAKLSCGGEGASGARALEANAPAAVTAKSSLTPEITENTADTSHNRDLVPLVTCTSDTSVHYPAAPAHPLGLSDQLIQGYRLDPAFNAEADLSSMYQDTHGLWRLTGKDKVVVPNDSELRNHILHEMHDAVYSGHVGISKTLERVSRVFWWNTMRADVRYYVSTCDACQRDKASTLKPGGLLNPLSIPDYRWESVSMDFITKLPSGSHGYDAICVFVDSLSKMVHFVPCREDLKARRFAQLFIDHVYKLHGMPAELISDRGSLFTSVFWREIMRRCGSKPALSSSYHPQSDGQTERYNRVLEEMLRHYISPTQSDWPDYLALAEFAVNNSWQESIQSTPFLVNTGQSPVTVGLRDLPYGGRCPSAHAFTRWWQDAVANARKCMAAAQSRQAAYANKARRDVEYKVGQKVLLSTKNLKLQPGKARKLIPRYVGPFEILLLVGAVAVKLDLPASMSRLHPVFHVSLIKPYTGTDVGFMPPPVTWMDETPVYYVERLLDHKGVKDNKASYYLVQWEGYDSTHNTWEPRSNLTDCDKVLAEYNAIHHLKSSYEQRSQSRSLSLMAGQDGDGGKPSSLEWQHVTSTKLLHGHSISCNYCHAKFSGGATRIRDHMCRCAAAPNAVKLLFGTRIVDAKEKATAAKAKRTLNFNTGATGARSPTVIVTDSAAVMPAAVRALHDMYPETRHISWVPCIVHWCSLVIKDIAVLTWVGPILGRAMNVIKAILGYGALLSIFSSHSRRMLLMYGDTRMATKFLAAERLLLVKDALEKTVVDDRWKAFARAKPHKLQVPGVQLRSCWDVNREDMAWCMHACMQVANAVRSAVQCDRFWEDLQLLVHIMEPVLVLLRLFDTPEPRMGKVYWKFHQLAAEVTKPMPVDTGKGIATRQLTADQKLDLEEVVSTRRDRLHQPLHAAAYALDPEYSGHVMNAEVTNSLADIVQLLSLSTGAAGRALIQFAHYKAQHNIFSRPIVQNAAKELPGCLFWETYGKGYPDLQYVATRLLAQPASSSAAEQNFSKYGFILSKRRNRLTTSRASMLVFNFSNSRLLRRTQQLDADRHPVPWSDSEASNSAANSEECSGSDANDEAEA